MKIRHIILSTMLILGISTSSVLAAERVSLGFIYGADDQVELVDRTNGSINQVSPTCFDINSRGNLVITSELTHEFVAAMKERNIIVTPFLSNHWVRSKGRAALKNAENLTNQIVTAIEEYQLDGVNIDIENLTPDDRDSLSNFVKLLSEKLPEDKILSVSVAANPDASETGWQGSYDYAKLGAYSDYLFVMTYDEHGQGGACGPVASLEFSRKSIEYTLRYVSKDKIVMGIPFFGRYWKNGEDYGGDAIVIGAMPALLSKIHEVIRYDVKVGEACVKFHIENPVRKVKINGKVLENGDYTIWYPNEESIRLKLNLVNEYDLLGAGVWALGQEKVDVWEYYHNELNKIPYISPEEARIQAIREAYEALVVDMSNMEEPNIHPLQNEKDEKIEIQKVLDESINKERRKEEAANIHVENLKKINLLKDSESLKSDIKNIKNEFIQLIKENVSEYKTIHIYQYCRKERLK